MHQTAPRWPKNRAVKLGHEIPLFSKINGPGKQGWANSKEGSSEVEENRQKAKDKVGKFNLQRMVQRRVAKNCPLSGG